MSATTPYGGLFYEDYSFDVPVGFSRILDAGVSMTTGTGIWFVSLTGISGATVSYYLASATEISSTHVGMRFWAIGVL